MSQANRVGKQNARERVAAERLARQRAERRRRQITIGTAVVGVIGLAGGIGIAVAASQHDKPYLAPAGAVVDTQAKSDKDLGIHVGSADAPVKLVIFEDFRCPVCQQIEQAVEPTYKEYVEAGKVQITYHPARLIDGNNGGVGSLNGANAAACAQDQSQFIPLHDLLYANQPNEQTDGYGNKATILSIANQIPELKASPAFQACVTKGDHDGWVQKNADNFNKLKLPGTPTIFLDGQELKFGQNSPDAVKTYFQQQLDAAFTKDGGKAGTATKLPTAPTSSPSGAPSSGAPSSGGSSSAPPAAGSSSPSASGASGSSAPSSPSGSSSSSKS
jgi:protein-disulfide isomerase